MLTACLWDENVALLADISPQILDGFPQISEIFMVPTGQILISWVINC